MDGAVRAGGSQAISDAETHVDILREQVVRGLVLLNHIGVCASTGERCAEEEAEESVKWRELAFGLTVELAVELAAESYADYVTR